MKAGAELRGRGGKHRGGMIGILEKDGMIREKGKKETDKSFQLILQ